MTEDRAAYGAGKKKEGMTVDEFISKYYCPDYNPGKAQMRADLEEMMKAASQPHRPFGDKVGVSVIQLDMTKTL